MNTTNDIQKAAIYAAATYKSDSFHWSHEVGGAFVGVSYSDDAMWIAFRGTVVSEYRDILADVRFGNGQTPFGRARFGFFEHHQKLWKKLRQHIDDIKPKKIFITGHSLGGAMATISAAKIWGEFPHLHSNRRDDIHLITFGSPRVGRRGFVATLNYELESNVSRVVYGRDRVPSMPPFICGWWHTRGRLYIGRDGIAVTDEGGHMWGKMFLGLAMMWFVPWWVKDHSMSTYLVALRTIKKT